MFILDADGQCMEAWDKSYPYSRRHRGLRSFGVNRALVVIAHRGMPKAYHREEAFQECGFRHFDSLRALEDGRGENQFTDQAGWFFAAPRGSKGTIFDGLPAEYKKILRLNASYDLVNVPDRNSPGHFDARERPL